MPIMLKGEGKCRKGYVWGITANKEKLVWFHYNNGSRSQECLKQIIKEYRGTVQSDSYSAYHLFDKDSYKNKILRLSCLAHIRRKIFESISTDGKAQRLFDLINTIYHHEHLWQQENLEREKSGHPLLTPQQITLIRKRDEYPLMKQLYQLLQQYVQDKTILPKSNLGKAVAYPLNEAPGILHCLKSGEYHLDNNAIERQFKDLIIGRKNYLFCEGHSSAERTASIYSLIGCCKLNNVDPLQYLTDVLGRINGNS
ncbi:MAG: transposase [Bacteroidales bacterium]